MEKDFDRWNGEKKNLESTGFETLPFHEREIWWCSIGVNLGDEQDGKTSFLSSYVHKKKTEPLRAPRLA